MAAVHLVPSFAARMFARCLHARHEKWVVSVRSETKAVSNSAILGVALMLSNPGEFAVSQLKLWLPKSGSVFRPGRKTIQASAAHSHHGLAAAQMSFLAKFGESESGVFRISDSLECSQCMRTRSSTFVRSLARIASRIRRCSAVDSW